MIPRAYALAVLAALGMAPFAQTQVSKPLFIAGDMVTGPGGSGPLCVLRSQFMRNERVAWRIRVEDSTGKQLDEKGLKGVVVELSDGRKFPAHFGGHPPDKPTDYLWSTSWTIPEDYPTGTLNYKVVATALDGTMQSWEPINNKLSWLTVIPGTFQPAK